MGVLQEPFTIEEIKGKRDASNFIEGTISVNLYDMVKMDEDQFLDTISEKLTGRTTLEMVDYIVVGHLDDYTVLIKVKGSVDRILDEYEEYGE